MLIYHHGQLLTTSSYHRHADVDQYYNYKNNHGDASTGPAVCTVQVTSVISSVQDPPSHPV